MRIRQIAPVLLLALPACGALFNSGPANVAFSTNPAGAEVLIDGTSRGITPTTLQLSKNRNYTVTMRLAGHQDYTTEIRKTVSGGYVVLDILFGVLPIVVDAATGSWYTLSTSNVSANLLPTTAMSGQLTPEQLAAVRLGTPVQNFIDAREAISAAQPALQQ